jgi:hypothetical protein
MITIPLYDTQLGFLDKIVQQGSHGSKREEVLRNALLEHVGQRVAGSASGYVGGSNRPDVLRARTPQYGASRLQHQIDPIEGKAVPLRRGEVLRIEQIGGETCVDFNAFNMEDYKESLDCGFTRSTQSFNPGRGEFVWTNAPRGRPMFTILEMPATCELDITGHRCNRVYQDLSWGLTGHANCQDTIAEAIREYGLTPDDVHDSFNMWMATKIDDEGRRQFRWNPGRPGDSVELLAMFDVLAATVICGSGELVGINNYKYESIRIEVLEPSAETAGLVEQINERWGRRSSQVTSDEMGDISVRSERALRRDEDYVSDFRAAPTVQSIEIDLAATERELLRQLMDTGVYGSSEGEAMRATFMRWCNDNAIIGARAKVEFSD